MSLFRSIGFNEHYTRFFRTLKDSKKQNKLQQNARLRLCEGLNGSSWNESIGKFSARNNKVGHYITFNLSQSRKANTEQTDTETRITRHITTTQKRQQSRAKSWSFSINVHNKLWANSALLKRKLHNITIQLFAGPCVHPVHGQLHNVRNGGRQHCFGPWKSAPPIEDHTAAGIL